MFGFPFPCKTRTDSGDKPLSFVLPQHPLSSPWNCRSWSQLFSAPSAVRSCAAPVSSAATACPKFVSLHLFVKAANSGQFNACTYKGHFYKFSKAWPIPQSFYGFWTPTCSQPLFLLVPFFWSSENAKTIWMKKRRNSKTVGSSKLGTI